MTTQTRRQTSDYKTIVDRLRTVSWSKYSQNKRTDKKYTSKTKTAEITSVLNICLVSLNSIYSRRIMFLELHVYWNSIFNECSPRKNCNERLSSKKILHAANKPPWVASVLGSKHESGLMSMPCNIKDWNNVEYYAWTNADISSLVAPGLKCYHFERFILPCQGLKPKKENKCSLGTHWLPTEYQNQIWR